MAKTLRLWFGLGFVGFLTTGALYLLYQCLKPSEPSIPSALPQSFVLKGIAVKGSTLISTDSKGHSLTLKIQDVKLDPKDSARDIYLYTVVLKTTAHWQNICQPDREGIAKALPLSGQWDTKGNHTDSERLTFACTNSALAKCVRWGYKPWKSFQGHSLRDFHQACTRMVRADYCGNGIAHTQDGTEIDVYDRLRIQKQTQQSRMMFEAAWSPDGAVAISRTRFSESMNQIRRDCPERLKPFYAESLSANNHTASLASLQQYVPKALIFNDLFVKP